MTKLTEVAKHFAESAKQQKTLTEQAVKDEFKRLNAVIKQESRSVETTFSNAIHRQHYKTALWKTFSMIPLAVVCSLGVTLTLMIVLLVGRSDFAIIRVETEKSGNQWYHCKRPTTTEDKQTWCLIREGS